MQRNPCALGGEPQPSRTEYVCIETSPRPPGPNLTTELYGVVKERPQSCKSFVKKLSKAERLEADGLNDKALTIS
jgi:hypothetical protein